MFTHSTVPWCPNLDAQTPELPGALVRGMLAAAKLVRDNPHVPLPALLATVSAISGIPLDAVVRQVALAALMGVSLDLDNEWTAEFQWSS